MKKALWVKTVLVVSLLLIAALPATAASSLTLVVDGVKAEVQPKLISGTTFIPIHEAAELLDAKVEYFASAKAVIVTSNDGQQPPTAFETTTTLKLIVNGTLSDAAPIVLDGAAYVPVRAAAELLGAEVTYDAQTYTVSITSGAAEYDGIVRFPVDSYPETAAHIKSAITNGAPAICTIDRTGAGVNREEALAGLDAKDGYEVHEWPLAICEEGGSGADAAYVKQSDQSRSAAWIDTVLDDYADGARVKFVFVVQIDENTFQVEDWTTKATPAEEPKAIPSAAPAQFTIRSKEIC